jgi:proline utilization trans-activator
MEKVCQAIGIAQLEGLHTQLPEDELGPETVIRVRDLWWTLYIMDRQYSSSLGIPKMTQDDDITTLLEDLETTSHQGYVLILQVQLWRVYSKILNSKFSKCPILLTHC